MAILVGVRARTVSPESDSHPSEPCFQEKRLDRIDRCSLAQLALPISARSQYG
jgi:hypothetical protein